MSEVIVDHRMVMVREVLGGLTTTEQIKQAQGLLNRRLAEIGNEDMRKAIDAGFVPGARVEVLLPRLRGSVERDFNGVIDSPNAQTFTVVLDSGKPQRFAPAQLKLSKLGKNK